MALPSRAALSITAGAIFFLAASMATAGFKEDFSGYPPGTVVGGDLPQGGTSPGNLFPNFTITQVEHNNSLQDAAVLFDSANPTGGDFDLGTPNETCNPPGPGIGIGGQVGQPGENCIPQGNVVIIADNLEDVNGDDIVDEPDDGRDGGSIFFEFDAGYFPTSLVVLDIDQESASVHLSGDTVNVMVNATDLGNNSAQVLDLSAFGDASSMRVTFSSSGAIAQLEYEFRPTAVEAETWATIKSRYRILR